jgi:hypothetical protein
LQLSRIVVVGLWLPVLVAGGLSAELELAGELEGEEGGGAVSYGRQERLIARI